MAYESNEQPGNYTHYGSDPPISPWEAENRRRGWVGNGIWKKGSEIDKEHWRKLNQTSADQRNRAFDFFKKLTQEHPEYDLSSFMPMFEQATKGYGGEGNTFESGNFAAPDERFKEFLNYKGGTVKPILWNGLETGGEYVDTTATGGKLPANYAYKYNPGGHNLTGTSPPSNWQDIMSGKTSPVSSAGGNIAQATGTGATQAKASNVALPAQLRQKSGSMFRNRNVGQPAPALTASTVQNAASNPMQSQNILMQARAGGPQLDANQMTRMDISNKMDPPPVVQNEQMQPMTGTGAINKFSGSILKPENEAMQKQSMGTMKTAYGGKQPILKTA